MNKQYTDNDILSLLAKTSSEIAPSEASFSNLLKTLPIKSPVDTPTAVPTRSTKSAYSVFFSPYLRYASAMAVFVFVLVGITRHNINNTSNGGAASTSNSVVGGEVAFDTAAGEPVTTNIGAANPAADPQMRSSAKIAQSIAATPETNELQNALANGLGAELTAHNDLLALSNGI